MFEDDAFEYVRRDLLETVGETETRRQSASDLTRALMEQFESKVTEIISRYIQAHLQQYTADPATNWKAKDTAIFLLTSIAARGSTAQHGVTSTNSLIDVVQFFSDAIVQDLQADAKVHPIILADAIKFLYTFRSQVSCTCDHLGTEPIELIERFSAHKRAASLGHSDALSSSAKRVFRHPYICSNDHRAHPLHQATKPDPVHTRRHPAIRRESTGRALHNY